MPRLVGHAARFGELSTDLGGFRERISQEAFRATMKSGDCRALWNHDSRLLLGRASKGTLKLSEDRDGLVCDIQLPDTSYARDLAAIIRRGDLDGMSFGFRVIRDEWEQVGSENIRTLKEVELQDVSPVTFPAYPQTDVAMRSLNVFLSAKTASAQVSTAVSRGLDLDTSGAVEIARLRRRLEDHRFID
jgi:HK97 family phage prohead protease